MQPTFTNGMIIRLVKSWDKESDMPGNYGWNDAIEGQYMNMTGRVTDTEFYEDGEITKVRFVNGSNLGIASSMLTYEFDLERLEQYSE